MNKVLAPKPGVLSQKTWYFPTCNPDRVVLEPKPNKSISAILSQQHNINEGHLREIYVYIADIYPGDQVEHYVSYNLFI